MHKEHRPCADYRLSKPVGLGEIPMCYVDNNREVGQRNVKRTGLGGFFDTMTTQQKVMLGVGGLVMAVIALKGGQYVVNLPKKVPTDVDPNDPTLAKDPAPPSSGKLNPFTTYDLSSSEAAAFKSILPAPGRQYADVIVKVAREQKVSPFVLAGLMHVETYFGAGAACKGQGPRCRGSIVASDHGLMQINKINKALLPDWDNQWFDPYWNIYAATKVWNMWKVWAKKKGPKYGYNVTDPKSLAIALAASYNAGGGAVEKKAWKKGLNPDVATYDGKYAAKSMALAEEYAKKTADASGGRIA